MARNLPDMMEQLNYALQAKGYEYDEATVAVCIAIVTCLPSHSALLTLALEAAQQGRRMDDDQVSVIVERACAIEQPRIASLAEMDPDDIPW